MIELPDGLRLPEGTLLLHIDPDAIGARLLQAALDARRRELADQGVSYVGPGRWPDLLRELRRAPAPWVVVSDTNLADLDEAGIHRVVADVGQDRVHVVITVHPPAVSLARAWQDEIEAGITLAFDAWLDAMLPDAMRFGGRYRYDRLAARWAAVVGAERVSVALAEGPDENRVPQVFETLLGLRAGMLARATEPVDRGLTLPEAETIRALNVAFREEGLGDELHARVIRSGAAAYLRRRTPRPGEPLIEPPAWALERVAEHWHEIVECLVESGVPVIGDLRSLVPGAASLPTERRPSAEIPQEIWAEIGAYAAVGILLATGPPAGAPARNGPIEPFELARLSTPLLGLLLMRRLAGSAVARLPLRRSRA